MIDENMTYAQAIEKKTGGAAFPNLYPRSDEDGRQGMSMLDYFAGQAMQGLCANPGGPFQRSEAHGWTLVNCTIDQVSETCFDMAKSMLAERARRMK